MPGTVLSFTSQGISVSKAGVITIGTCRRTERLRESEVLAQLTAEKMA